MSVETLLVNNCDVPVIEYISEMIKLNQTNDLELFLSEFDCLHLLDQLLALVPRQQQSHIQKLDHAVELHTFKGNTFKEKRKDISALRDNTTIVDQEELVKAEKKLLEKRERKKDRNTVKEIHLSSLKRVTLTDEQVFQQYVAHKQAKSMDIFIDNLTLNLYGLTVLTNAELKLSYKRIYGLIGMNGIGKSTLLHAITAREVPIPFHLKVVYVEQELVENNEPIIEMVLKADQLREYLIKKEKELLVICKSQDAPASAQEELQQIYNEMDVADIHSAESRAASLLIGLGFKHEQLSWPQSKFSGGWKMRVALAKALFTSPDLLLLDEPTNHLDIPAVAWLANYLLNDFNGTCLVVSHDRAFLDLVATDIMHMYNQSIKSYKGNFTQFEKTRKDLTIQQIREFENQSREKAHLQAFVDRFRASAARASQAQSKLKIIEKMPDLVMPEITELDEDVVPYHFEQPDKVSITLIELRDVHFNYDGMPLIVDNLSLRIRMDSKTILVGGNGQGKSTILKLMMKSINPKSGDVIQHGNMRIGYFSQHHMDMFSNMDQNAVEYLQSVKPGQSVQEYRSHLGGFGISGSVSLQSLNTLSGGQKSRVSFASLSLQLPNVLILDEVSNHLDIVSLKAMAMALRDFTGGLVLVSHDVKFIETVFNEEHSTKQMIVVEYGKTIEWPNTDIYDYQRYCLGKK
eukprot:NODE_144_length_17694_cov_0.489741.p2 type:complete len:689 gc:universal NODE_144_length_17694_cov_0.489741:13658-15724(+)